jgi:ABC-type nickel/cobalt efflux system permease component RcnA
MIFEVKAAAFSLGVGTFGLLATEAVPMEFGYLRTVAELGSFGLVAFAAIMLLVKVAPAFIQHLDKARDSFLIELKQERDQRHAHSEKINASLHQLDTSLRDIHNTIRGGIK